MKTEFKFNLPVFKEIYNTYYANARPNKDLSSAFVYLLNLT